MTGVSDVKLVQETKQQNSVEEIVSLQDIITECVQVDDVKEEDVKPHVQKTQSVIIQPRRSSASTQRNASPVSSMQRVSVISRTPAPVIIRPRLEETRPRPVTDQLFAPKRVESKPVTEMLFFPKKAAPRSVTELLFDSSSVVDTLAAAEKDENDFFEELFSNLEQIEDLEYLAPHAGDVAIDLKAPEVVLDDPDKPVIETFSLDDLMVLDYETKSPLTNNAVQKKCEDEMQRNQQDNDIFLNPGRNMMMWGNTGSPNMAKKPRVQQTDGGGSGSGLINTDQLLRELFESDFPGDQVQQVPVDQEEVEVVWDNRDKCVQRIQSEEILQVPKSSGATFFLEIL